MGSVWYFVHVAHPYIVLNVRREFADFPRGNASLRRAAQVSMLVTLGPSRVLVALTEPPPGHFPGNCREDAGGIDHFVCSCGFRILS